MNASLYFRLGALAAAITLTGPAAQALAQQSPFLDFNHPSVTVDLSVIDDSGYGAPAIGGGAAPMSIRQRGKLLVPGSRAPRSMLHVPPVGGRAAAPVPAAQPIARVAPAPAPASAPMAKAEPAPAPAPVAEPQKTVIAETPTPEPEKLQAPAPVAAPAAPPPPTVAAAPKVTPTEIVKKEPAKAAEPNKTETAALPPAGGSIEPGLALQVIFANDATRLPAGDKEKLKSLADRVKSQENIRLQLMAYAGGDKLSASLARRLSLSRALSVRSFLIENGIRSTRIDVRALGNKTSEKPLNRVDLNITER